MNISCMPWFFFFKKKQKKHKAYICHNIDDLVLSGESLEVWGDERRDQGCVANPPPLCGHFIVSVYLCAIGWQAVQCRRKERERLFMVLSTVGCSVLDFYLFTSACSST